jgi:hypothetical protein
MDARKWREDLTVGGRASVINKNGKRVTVTLERRVRMAGTLASKAWLCSNGEIYAAFEMTPPSGG